MKIPFDQIKVGDFFTVNFENEDTLLYQKVTSKEGYNAVLLNSGQLCYLYTTDKTTFDRVEVDFEIKFL